MNKPGLWLVLLVGVLVPWPRLAAGEVLDIRIVRYGVYRAEGGQGVAAEADGGEVVVADGLALEAQTRTVTARVGTIIGLDYVMSAEEPCFGETVEVVVNHPPITPPGRSTPRRTTSWRMYPECGETVHTGWLFSRPWELVPGPYTFHLRDRGRTLAGLTLHVRLDEPAPEAGQGAAVQAASRVQTAAKMPVQAAPGQVGPLPGAAAGPSGPGEPLYFVQVAAYRNRDSALAHSARLAGQGREAFVLPLYDDAGRPWHLVGLGPAQPTEEAARRALRDSGADRKAGGFVKRVDRSLFEERVVRGR